MSKIKVNKRKIIVFTVIGILLLAFILKGLAYMDIISFGFNQNRTRYNYEMYGGIAATQVTSTTKAKLGWYVTGLGPSLSQPLIISPKELGINASQPIVIAFNGNNLYAYESISPYSKVYTILIQAQVPTHLHPKLFQTAIKNGGLCLYMGLPQYQPIHLAAIQPIMYHQTVTSTLQQVQRMDMFLYTK
ncbi:hypothetical protein JCM16816_22050 [Thermoanaerobacter brockii subsp. lactiethylicus]